MNKTILTTLVASSLVAGSVANAFTLNFSAYSPDGSLNIDSTTANNLGGFHQVDVSEGTGNTFDFTFTNSDTVHSSAITELYFGVGTNFTNTFIVPGTITDETGEVDFSATGGANPSDLPPGNTTFAHYAIESGGPTKNGLSNNESLTISFATQSGVSLDLSGLEALFTSGDLQIGTHTRSIDNTANGDNFSQWFTSDAPGGSTVTPPDPVPEPSTYAMFGTAFAILGFAGYRSRSRKS